MRIVFVGAVEFSRTTLEAVVAAGGDVVAVLTLPTELAARHSDFVDLGAVADEHGIPVHRIRQIGAPETIELLRSLEPDIVFVFGWSQLIPATLLDLPRLGFVGTHPALLPQGRGRHPIVWTLVEGHERSGLTFFFLDEGADSGDILWQRAFDVTLEDDAASLYRKIEELAVVGIHEIVPRLEQGTVDRIPQDDTQATYWRKRDDADRRIDWTQPSLTIYNLVRALTHPYVGAITGTPDGDAIVWRSRLSDDPLGAAERAAPPGTILSESGGEIVVRTGDTALVLTDVEPYDPTTFAVGRLLGAA